VWRPLKPAELYDEKIKRMGIVIAEPTQLNPDTAKVVAVTIRDASVVSVDFEAKDLKFIQTYPRRTPLVHTTELSPGDRFEVQSGKADHATAETLSADMTAFKIECLAPVVLPCPKGGILNDSIAWNTYYMTTISAAAVIITQMTDRKAIIQTRLTDLKAFAVTAPALAARMDDMIDKFNGFIADVNKTDSVLNGTLFTAVLDDSLLGTRPDKAALQKQTGRQISHTTVNTYSVDWYKPDVLETIHAPFINGTGTTLATGSKSLWSVELKQLKMDLWDLLVKSATFVKRTHAAQFQSWINTVVLGFDACAVEVEELQRRFVAGDSFGDKVVELNAHITRAVRVQARFGTGYDLKHFKDRKLYANLDANAALLKEWRLKFKKHRMHDTRFGLSALQFTVIHAVKFKAKRVQEVDVHIHPMKFIYGAYKTEIRELECTETVAENQAEKDMKTPY
jgi:hypothetical protein